MKKILLSAFIFVCMLAFGVALKASAEKAGGWPWGGGTQKDAADISNTNVGWISMNSANCDYNEDGHNDSCDLNDSGSIEASEANASVANYSVDIPGSPGGPISGHAWSPNIGWISFNAADLTGCPNGACQASRDASNNLVGWARIVGIKDEAASSNSGGWQGFISLSSKNCDANGDEIPESCAGAGTVKPYGIQINSEGKIDRGPTTSFAWSDELGWIDFSKATAKPPCHPVYTYTCDKKTDPSGICNSTNCGQQVTTEMNVCTGVDNACGTGQVTGTIGTGAGFDCQVSACPNPSTFEKMTCNPCPGSGKWIEVNP